MSRVKQDDIEVAGHRIKTATEVLKRNTTPVMIAKAVNDDPTMARPYKVVKDDNGAALVDTPTGPISVKEALARAVGLIETANEAMDANVRRAAINQIKAKP